jgi:four helix bundle protein
LTVHSEELQGSIRIEHAMSRFTELKVWQRSHALVLQVYRLTKSFPPDDRFGLTSQLRRAALSVPTHIAESSKRQTNAEYARFLNIAEGSLAETEYLLTMSCDLQYLSSEVPRPALIDADETGKMLHGLHSKVIKQGPTP